MDRFSDERDFRLLESDRYTFSVLSRVLRGPCDCILTDHERIIFCHTTLPYPVWLWTPDGIGEYAKETAWQLASRTLPLSEGYRYNLKYELAEYFIARAQQEGLTAHIATNMFAYDCPSPIVPATATDGHLHVCTSEDTEEAARMIYEFHEAVHADQQNLDRCRMKAEQHINHEGFFFWKNEQNETVACCSWHPNEGLGCVGSVYTRPEHRRQHYAQHLVYQITKMIADKGLTPMLYTDADYIASNACYEKIGYVLRGKLCTISI